MIIYPNNKSEIIHFEEMSLNAWPAISVTHHQGCILRLSNGYTKRANSVNPLYCTGNCHEIIDYAEDLYSRNSLPTVFKMLKHPRYESLDRVLEERGYAARDATNVKLVDLRTHDFEDAAEVEVDRSFSSKWIREFIAANRLEGKADTVEQILKRISVETLVASITVNDGIIAFGFGAVEENIVGIFDVFVDERYRRQGYARKIMNKLLFLSKERSIDYSYLQVVAENKTAEKLYQSLGYRAYYEYWYRVRARCDA
jgi:GNAT superfamily N-acetyltransferase